MEQKRISKKVLYRALQKLKEYDDFLEGAFRKRLEWAEDRLDRKKAAVMLMGGEEEKLTFINRLLEGNIFSAEEGQEGSDVAAPWPEEMLISVEYGENRRVVFLDRFGEPEYEIDLGAGAPLKLYRKTEWSSQEEAPSGIRVFYPCALLKRSLMLCWAPGGQTGMDADGVLLPENILQEDCGDGLRFSDAAVQRLDTYFNEISDPEVRLRNAGRGLADLSADMTAYALNREKRLLSEIRSDLEVVKENGMQRLQKNEESCRGLEEAIDGYLAVFHRCVMEDLGTAAGITDRVSECADTLITVPSDVTVDKVLECLNPAQEELEELVVRLEAVIRSQTEKLTNYTDAYLKRSSVPRAETNSGLTTEAGTGTESGGENFGFQFRRTAFGAGKISRAVLEVPIPEPADRSAIMEFRDQIGGKRQRLEEERQRAHQRANEQASLAGEQLEIQLKERTVEVYKEFQDRIKALGTRPQPIPRYKTIYWTSGNLFWKKQHSKQIPDGFDTSAAERWDRGRKEAETEYQRKCGELKEEIQNRKARILQNEEEAGGLSLMARELESLEEACRAKEDALDETDRLAAVDYVRRVKSQIAALCGEGISSIFDAWKEEAKGYLDGLKARITSQLEESLAHAEGVLRTELATECAKRKEIRQDLRTKSRKALRGIEIARNKIKEEIGDECGQTSDRAEG